MTRREAERLVQQPGKFAGEPPWTPYFYDLLDGAAEQVSENTVAVPIDPIDVGQFPELSEHSTIYLTELDEGFVIGYAE